MTTKAQVREFLNDVSKKKYGQSYSSLSDAKASKVRKEAVKMAFRKKRKKF